MNPFIGAKRAGNLLLSASGLLAVFHILVLLRVIPARVVWGGAIQKSISLFTLEMVAWFVTLFLSAFAASESGYIEIVKFKTAINSGVWCVFAILLLSLAGNLASGVSFEKLVFAPIIVILAFCAYRLAIEM